MKRQERTEIRQTTWRVLESEAYEGEIANDGLIAWEKLSHQCERYEMVLWDVTMPRMGGIPLIQMLQQRADGGCCNIIVLSADGDAV